MVSEIILIKKGLVLTVVSSAAGERPRAAARLVGPRTSNGRASMLQAKDSITAELRNAERATRLVTGTIAGSMWLACLVELMLRRLYMFLGMAQLAATRRPNMTAETERKGRVGRGKTGYRRAWETNA